MCNSFKTSATSTIEWTKVRHDSNGNPRYVCHFLDLLTPEEKHRSGEAWIPIAEKYRMALARAHKIGGRKFHNKQYGGGIVFQSYNLEDTEHRIAAELAHKEREVSIERQGKKRLWIVRVDGQPYAMTNYSEARSFYKSQRDAI